MYIAFYDLYICQVANEMHRTMSCKLRLSFGARLNQFPSVNSLF